MTNKSVHDNKKSSLENNCKIVLNVTFVSRLVWYGFRPFSSLMTLKCHVVLPSKHHILSLHIEYMIILSLNKHKLIKFNILTKIIVYQWYTALNVCIKKCIKTFNWMNVMHFWKKKLFDYCVYFILDVIRILN